MNIRGKLSFVPSFLFPERLHCCCISYLFTAPTRRTTIITLQPCALNAEFQHFSVLRFNKISLLCGTTDSERGDRGVNSAREGDFLYSFIARWLFHFIAGSTVKPGLCGYFIELIKNCQFNFF